MKDRFTCFYKSWIRRNAPPRLSHRVKIRGTTQYAGVVELVDSVDLGAVTSVKVCLPPPARTIAYAPVAKMVYAVDLGAVTSVKVSRFHGS